MSTLDARQPLDAPHQDQVAAPGNHQPQGAEPGAAGSARTEPDGGEPGRGDLDGVGPDGTRTADSEPAAPDRNGAEPAGADPHRGEPVGVEPAGAGATAQAFRDQVSAAERQNRLAMLATFAFVVVLAFGAGIAIGRATAPAGGSAAAVGSSPVPIATGPSAASSGAAAAAGTGPTVAPGSSSPLDGLPSDGSLLGSKDAKVTLTYWADFQCPYCERFATNVLPLLASRIADGTVAVQHRDFVFIGPESIDAAVAVRCGGEQGKFWPMHDAVYGAQAGENQGAFARARLAQIAASIGLDATSFTTCLDRPDLLAAVMADTSAGVRAGVTSTPTLDLPGQRFLGVPDTTAFLKAIDSAAASAATPTAAPSASPSGDPWAGTPTSGREAGAPSAPVTVEVYADYQSADMPALVQKLEPELRTRVAAGKVRLVLRDLASLGDESVTAASFVRCVAQAGGSGWFASDLLGVSAKGANQGIFVSRNLLWLAAKLGYDVTAISTCMTDPATTAAVKAETAVGTGLGLAVAPSIVVKVGDRETARFSGALDVAKVLAAVDAAK